MSLKIVLADDSLTAQNMGKKILADAGYEVIAVSNGAQAMKKIVSDKPDLVVLDVYMPGYSGVELCERLRHSRETAQTPVVLTVGKMEAFKPEEANRVGANGLIVKPFEATELVAVVKKLAENLAPALRPKRQPQPESVPQKAEPTPGPAEPELEVQHYAVHVPRERASEPVIGLDFIPQEAQEPAAAQASAAHSSAPIEFEVEHEAAPAEVDPSLRMASVAGLSGVFEMAPAAAPPVETAATAAPAEEFERFSVPASAEPQSQHEVTADPGPTTVAHDFQTEEPLELVDEPKADCHAAPAAETWSAPTVASSEPPLAVEPLELVDEPKADCHAAPAAETWSAPTVASSEPSLAVEPLDQAQAEPGVESVTPQSADVLPELASWDEPLPATPGGISWEAEEPSPELVLPEGSAEELASGAVWVAEEIEIGPHESAISLHQQMQQEGMAEELLESEPPATPVVSAEVSPQSWEVLAPSASDPAQPASESPGLSETEILPEFEPNPCAVPAEPAELASTDPYDSPDFPADLTATTDAQPATEPAPAPDLEPYAAASEFVPRITVPVMTEIPADPVRIARIVEEALQRLKPELIAAITRGMEKKDQ